MVKDRLLGFALVFGAGFVLLGSLVVGVALDMVGRLTGGDAYGQAPLWRALHSGVSFGLTALLFTLIFKVLPDAKVRWRDVWIGALATAALFSLGRFSIGLYLEKAATESVYGAAGSLVALLIWVYYSAQILFLGAEFTQVYARAHGVQIEPASNAVRLKEAERARQKMSGDRAGENVAEDASQIAARSVGRYQSRPTALAPLAGAVGGFIFGLLLGRRRS